MASGNLLCRWNAPANNPPSSNPATPDVRNGVPVLDFDPTTDEHAVFIDELPPFYGGGGLTLKLRWMASSATSNSTRWQASIERHQRGTDDADADSFAAAQSAGTAAVAPSGTEMETTITFTSGAQMDSLGIGEKLRLKVTRDADGTSGTDDMAGDAELVSAALFET